jgi:DeoR/GlpR family transcriptional regulator of sugar metabolism
MKRLLETGDHFEGGMTTSKYAGMCKCSKVTASRDLAYLEAQGLLRKRPGGGRSTSYEVRLPL